MQYKKVLLCKAFAVPNVMVVPDDNKEKYLPEFADNLSAFFSKLRLKQNNKTRQKRQYIFLWYNKRKADASGIIPVPGFPTSTLTGVWYLYHTVFFFQNSPNC